MKLAIILVVILSSCKSLDSQALKAANARLNYFDTDLLRYAGEDHRGNVMLSPASIKAVLAMILEGAEGETSSEIRSALRLYPHKSDVRAQLRAYLQTLNADSAGTRLDNANLVFLSPRILVKMEFEKMLKNLYKTDLFSLDFMQPAVTASTINDWVDQKTQGLIQNVISPNQINPSTDILLINALYFKGSWRHAFNPSQTRSGCFYNRGVCRNVAMMELTKELNYAFVENLRAHAVELPYEGDRFSMYLLVPQDRDGHSTLIRDLPYMSLPEVIKLMRPADVELNLPKFNVDYSGDLVKVLQSMKITTLFTPKANLSGIFQGATSQVSNIFHKVHLEVNEEGTVAAAATGAVVIPLISSAVRLTVDRPFVFFIRDNDSGLVLFEGKIEEPTSYASPNSFSGQSQSTPGRNKIRGGK